MSDINAFYKALHQVGILNSGSMEQTGEKYFLERYLPIRKSPVVFDVGACSGSYSSTVRAISPSARLFAFEPHPASFERLRATLAGTGATLVRTALGNENGTTSFYDYADQDGTSHATLYKDIIDQIHKGTSKAIDVPIRRLDDLLPELGVEHIDFLKIDTEGHELSVLRGAAKAIADGRIDAIQFEFNETHVISRTFFKDFWDFLPDYRFMRLLPNNVIGILNYDPNFCEIFAFQNIVCVRKDVYARHFRQ
jgi:FkbM family methyltransferase